MPTFDLAVAISCSVTPWEEDSEQCQRHSLPPPPPPAGEPLLAGCLVNVNALCVARAFASARIHPPVLTTTDLMWFSVEHWFGSLATVEVRLPPQRAATPTYTTYRGCDACLLPLYTPPAFTFPTLPCFFACRTATTRACVRAVPPPLRHAGATCCLAAIPLIQHHTTRCLRTRTRLRYATIPLRSRGMPVGGINTSAGVHIVRSTGARNKTCRRLLPPRLHHPFYHSKAWQSGVARRFTQH